MNLYLNKYLDNLHNSIYNYIYSKYNFIVFAYTKIKENVIENDRNAPEIHNVGAKKVSLLLLFNFMGKG